MATAFNEKEKELIKTKLKNAAAEYLGKFGVRKTTVDQLVQMAGISKGAFYSFYPTKEILFFEVFEEYQKDLVENVFSQLIKAENIGIKEFTELIYGLYEKVRYSFIMNIIQNQEFEYLVRKLPEEYLLAHQSFDDLLVNNLLTHLKLKKDIEASVISASLRAIFMSMLHVKEIGDKDFEKAMRLLIKGLGHQLIEEACIDERSY